MNTTIVRASLYSGIGGVIVGVIGGIALATFDLRFLTPDKWYRLHAYEQASRSENAPERGRAAEDEFLAQFDMSNLTVPEDELRRGGPDKSGIPSLTHPSTLHATCADFLNPNDRIVAVTVGDESRAYPIGLLNWHEIVNDTIAGVPVAIVYCPLCDSVTVVDRRMGDETLEFGVSGMLYQSNVLMYDRQHNGLWSQILLEAISGPYAGTSLRHYSGWSITTFEHWRRSHPDGTVVSFDTGYQRNYDMNPYDDYMRTAELYFPVKRDDHRLERKDRVIGIRFNNVIRAYPIQTIHRVPNGRLIDEIAGSRFVFEVDIETGHTGVIESPDDAQIIHTFWFSWAAVYPETEIYGKE